MVARRPDDRRRAPSARRHAGDRDRRRRHEGRASCRGRAPHAVRHARLAPGRRRHRRGRRTGRGDVQSPRVCHRRLSRASTDAHNRRRAVAGRRAGRQDDRFRRLHDRTATTCSRCRIRRESARSVQGVQTNGACRLLTKSPTSAGQWPTPRSDRRSQPTPRCLPTLEADVVDAGRRDRRRSGARGRRHQRLRRARLSRVRGDRDLARLEPDGAPTPSARDAGLAALLRATPAGGRRSTRRRRAETSFFAGPATDAGTPTAATRRERQIEGGVLFPIRHARAACGTAVGRPRRGRLHAADGSLSRPASAVRAPPGRPSPAAPTATRSARSTASRRATAEIVRRGLGSFADATSSPATRAPTFPALAPHHVVGRARGGGTSDAATRRSAARSCSAARPPTPSVVDFGRQAVSLLRGFGDRHLRRQPRGARERRVPLADRAAAARRSARGRSSAHDARRGVRRRRPRVDAHLSQRRDQVVCGRADLRGCRRRLLRAVHRDRRRRLGTRRQRRA